MVDEARKRLAALRGGGAGTRKRGVRAVGHWAVLRKWLDPKFVIALLAALAALRSSSRAEKGTEQVATSVVAMVRDNTEEAGVMDSLRREMGWLRERVTTLEDIRDSSPARERAAPSTAQTSKSNPIELLAAPARAVVGGLKWLFLGG